ncbi:MAG: right-handed parallel beta-helix repeat-containing protein, partial [Thermoplasmatales archaeon]|nr:right-handed parallel beta-helix repeat-containing protein [Thermoplasmatales archaeon]
LNGAGIYGLYPEAINIEGNVIINNARGIHFYTIKTSNINGNIVSNNTWGIHINGAVLCTVQNNWIIDNSQCGIALEDSVSINVRENEIRDNRVWAGILLYRSYDFRITQNNFIDNGKNGTIHSFAVNCHTFMGFASNYYHPRRVSFKWYVHVGFIHIKRIPDLQLPFIFHIDFSAEDELLKIPNPVPNYPII